MTYCIMCQKVTNSYIEYNNADDYSKKYRMVILTCEHCGHFKCQYLEEIKNV